MNIIAVTGTRKGMTQLQKYWFLTILPNCPDELMHGGAEGADEDADTLFGAFEAFGSLAAQTALYKKVSVYPCNEARFSYWLKKPEPRIINQILPPLVRNELMVKRCSFLVATPASQFEQIRSGTWATIRYARKTKKPGAIVFPDGRIEAL